MIHYSRRFRRSVESRKLVRRNEPESPRGTFGRTTKRTVLELCLHTYVVCPPAPSPSARNHARTHARARSRHTHTRAHSKLCTPPAAPRRSSRSGLHALRNLHIPRSATRSANPHAHARAHASGSGRPSLVVFINQPCRYRSVHMEQTIPGDEQRPVIQSRTTPFPKRLFALIEKVRGAGS